MKTIKSRLILSSGLIFLLVCLSSAFIVMSIRQNDEYLAKEQIVEERLESLQHLSVGAYRYFKQIGDILLLGNLTPGLDKKIEFDIVVRDLKTMQQSFNEESRKVVPVDAETLTRVQEIDRVLNESNITFENLQIVETWEEIGQGWRLLRELLDEKIDRQLRTLIRDGVREESRQLAALRSQYRNNAYTVLVLGTSLGIVVAATTLIILLLLYKSIKQPLRQLSEGTEAIVEGNYDHEIDISEPFEYAELAERFNAMASQLAVQQRDLLNSHDMLEAEVSSQTLKLKETNLELEKLDASRKRLLLDVGHELRTPLTVLQGEVDVALRQSPSDEQAMSASLKRISEISGSISRLVSDLFLLVRTDFGAEQFHFETVDYRAVLGEIADASSMLAARKKLSFDFDLPTYPVFGQGDPHRLKQAIMAIVENAVRYTSEGGKIDLDYAHTDGKLQITVEDDGIGISDDDRERIFERFYRSPAARKHAPHGSGLGLALCRQIVRQHGGDVYFDPDKPERGTKAIIELPVVDTTDRKANQYAK